MNLTEEELNEQIDTTQWNLRLKRKYEYITAIDWGEELTINPYEYDEPVAVPEYPEYRYCKGLMKM